MRRLFWIGLIAGWGIMGYGLAGVIREADRTHPGDFALWFFGSALAHDLVIAPLAFLVALLAVRRLPGPVQPYATFALVVAGPVFLLSLPLVLGRGGAPGNDSALPRNYPAGLGIVLAAIVLATAAVYLVQRRRHKNSAPRNVRPEGPSHLGAS